MRTPLAIGTLLLATQASLAAQTPAPETVTVSLSSFKFSPSELTLRQGREYRLHLVNTSGGGHDFTAPEFFAASLVAPGNRVLVAGGKVKLAGRQSVDVILTPEKTGTYPLHCSHFMHSSMGMSGRIDVE